MQKKFNSFKEFYPFYLAEHANPICRLLHFIGSLSIVMLLVFVLLSGRWPYLIAMPLIGYGFAWLGHYAFEKNQPATFRYPFYSLIGDWVMFKDILLGKVKIKDKSI
ncbi:MAG: rane protein-like protein [Gammaproteobacteria bacterium]|jgi:hypothetical protein|nr:rane protein-like protein [Gammaproteobacteria bacterium]